MRIDCATCPARNRACDDCVMTIIFSPSTRDYGPEGWLDDGVDDLVEAIDVLTATAMISPAAARTAISDIEAGQQAFLADPWPRLRAV